MPRSDSKPNAQRRTVTKADISSAVHREIGLSKADSMSLVAGCLNQLSGALISGENVKLANFGTFKLTHKKARYGRNPRTGQEAMVSARTVVTFKAAPLVITRVNIPKKGIDE